MLLEEFQSDEIFQQSQSNQLDLAGTPEIFNTLSGLWLSAALENSLIML